MHRVHLAGHGNAAPAYSLNDSFQIEAPLSAADVRNPERRLCPA